MCASQLQSSMLQCRYDMHAMCVCGNRVCGDQLSGEDGVTVLDGGRAVTGDRNGVVDGRAVGAVESS